MRNPEETRRRLLAAAKQEFAAYGIAGARVDRIAESAACNKQSIYQHFESKEGLFDAVFDAMVKAASEEVPIDGENLPAYAAQLFDRYEADPDILRLATWARLERVQSTDRAISGAAQNTSMKTKIAAVAKAQQAGKVSARLPAEQLMTLVIAMSTVQQFVSGDLAANVRHRNATRRALMEAVRLLTAP